MMASASPGEDGMVLRNPVDPNSYMGALVGTRTASYHDLVFSKGPNQNSLHPKPFNMSRAYASGLEAKRPKMLVFGPESSARVKKVQFWLEQSTGSKAKLLTQSYFLRGLLAIQSCNCLL